MTVKSVDLVLAGSTGGIGTHVRSLAEGLVRRGVTVSVLGPQSTEDLFGFTGIGARFCAVEISSGLNPIGDLAAVRRVRRLLSADVVHAHGLRAGAVAGIALGARKSARRPLITSWHNALIDSGAKAALWRRLAGVAARRADVTLGASADLVADARACGSVDARLGEVAAPTLPSQRQSAAEVRAELGGADRPLVVAIGRLHRQKGFATLVDASTAWRERQVLVVIAGDGPDRATLTEQIARVDAPVRLLGRRDDVADILRAADVAVISSIWEARALVAQEALLAGTPLVATEVGGIGELVGDAALLVTPADADALARAVGRLLDDATLAAQMGRRGQQRAAEWPNEDDVVQSTVALYDELLDCRR